MFLKTKMCKFAAEGRCRRGEACAYAHKVEELVPMPDLRRTKLCSALLNQGCCNEPSCRFAHSRRELRDTRAIRAAYAELATRNDKAKSSSSSSSRPSTNEMPDPASIRRRSERKPSDMSHTVPPDAPCAPGHEQPGPLFTSSVRGNEQANTVFPGASPTSSSSAGAFQSSTSPTAGPGSADPSFSTFRSESSSGLFGDSTSPADFVRSIPLLASMEDDQPTTDEPEDVSTPPSPSRDDFAAEGEQPGATTFADLLDTCRCGVKNTFLVFVDTSSPELDCRSVRSEPADFKVTSRTRWHRASTAADKWSATARS